MASNSEIHDFKTESEIRRLLGEEVKRIDEIREVRVVLYARVSSYDQEQHGDLDRQLELLRKYAQKKGYKIVEEIKDRASGLKEDRKGIKRIFDLAEKGLIDKVIVTYPDRGSGHVEVRGNMWNFHMPLGTHHPFGLVPFRGNPEAPHPKVAPSHRSLSDLTEGRLTLDRKAFNSFANLIVILHCACFKYPINGVASPPLTLGDRIYPSFHIFL